MRWNKFNRKLAEKCVHCVVYGARSGRSRSSLKITSLNICQRCWMSIYILMSFSFPIAVFTNPSLFTSQQEKKNNRSLTFSTPFLSPEFNQFHWHHSRSMQSRKNIDNGFFSPFHMENLLQSNKCTIENEQNF